nr:hypothetical protein [uncultured Sphingomonas sp.]
MKRWLERNAKAIQSFGVIVTIVAIVAALIGVKMQINASAQQAREQSARDIYREYLNLSISRPDLSDPDYCAIKGTLTEAAYENYLEYTLYTAEQLNSVSPDWNATMLDHLSAHRQALCQGGDWSDDTPAVQALITQFRASQCQKPVEPCRGN